MPPVEEALAKLRQRFPDVKKAVVAFSGGRDSHVLLHAAKMHASLPVRAIHVVHGLQPVAETWPAHCEKVCTDLGIALKTVRANVSLNGTGQEAAARAARYSAFEQHVQPDEVLLLAHHADDQAETLLLRLLRGTGLRGLGAMPEQRALGLGQLWRPLLQLSSEALDRYAQNQNLSWIEDPSNADPQFDRNFLRLNTLPRLKSRWPNMVLQLGAAARRASEAEHLLQQLLRPQLERLCADDGSLCCDGLLAVSAIQQKHLLRAWLAKFSDKPPSETQLHSVMRDVLSARRDADPCLCLHKATLRRHRDRLYWVPEVVESDLLTQDWHQLDKPLEAGNQRLDLKSDFGKNLAIPRGAQVQVRFRQGGERIRLRGGERSLKKHLQDIGVPSWQRYGIPLLFIEEELAAVWNYSIAEKFVKIY